MTAVKKSPAGAAKAAPAKKAQTAAKKSASKSATKAAPAKKAAPATKAAVGRSSRSTATTTPARATAKKSVPAKTSAPAKKPPAAKAPTKAPAKKAPAAKAPAKKTTVAKEPATKAAPAKKAAPVKKAVPEAPKRPTVGPYAKDTKFLDAQRVLLLEERTIYSGQAVDLRAEADSLALEREPGDVQFDEESGEGGTVTVDRERNLALSAQAVAAVEEIDDALRKLDRKTYGWCERCYQPIPKARLQALPFARLCVACKSGGLSRR